MKVIPTDLPEVLILEPRVFGDERGFFMESYNARAFNEAVGYDVRFRAGQPLAFSMRRAARAALPAAATRAGQARASDVRTGFRRGRRHAPRQPTLRKMGWCRVELGQSSTALDSSRDSRTASWC